MEATTVTRFFNTLPSILSLINTAIIFNKKGLTFTFAIWCFYDRFENLHTLTKINDNFGQPKCLIINIKLVSSYLSILFNKPSEILKQTVLWTQEIELIVALKEIKGKLYNSIAAVKVLLSYS